MCGAVISFTMKKLLQSRSQNG